MLLSQAALVPPYYIKPDEVILQKYIKQIEESDGFDILDYPGPWCGASLHPVRNVKDDHRLQESACAAIKFYNDFHDLEYKFVEIEKANREVVAGFIYYITFKAESSGGVMQTFQALVYSGMRITKVLLVRPKTDARIYPLVRFRTNRCIVQSVDLAIQFFNNTHGVYYELFEIEKANAEKLVGDFTMYYIIFKAVSSRGAMQTFEAHVHYASHEKSVLLVRPKV